MNPAGGIMPGIKSLGRGRVVLRGEIEWGRTGGDMGGGRRGMVMISA